MRARGAMVSDSLRHRRCALLPKSCYPSLLGGLRKYPIAARCFIDPHFDHTCRRDVQTAVTTGARLLKESQKPLIVLMQIIQNFQRLSVCGVIIVRALLMNHLIDGFVHGDAHFAIAFGDLINHRRELSALFFEEQSIIANIRSDNMP